MKICFFGVGGVGGYFGTIFANNLGGKHKIYFVARGAHKDAINKNGLTLKCSGGEQLINVSPEKCTDNVDDLPVCDIIVLSVKSYDLTNATKSIEKLTDKKTIILPLLNGVDIYERIRKHLLTGIILRSCVYIGAHIESPGIIFQQGGSCNIFIGNDPRFPDLFPDSLVTLLEEAKIDYKWDDNIEVSIWSKYIFIAAYGLVSATYEKTLGEILNDLELCEITRSIMAEIELIARSMNIPLIDNILDTSFFKAKQFPYETKTSFQRDVELRGKKNEIDLFGETLIKYSVKYNVPIPNIKNIYDKFLDEH